MYIWSPDSIRFRVDAAKYTNYDERIVAQILPQLPNTSHVCDAGCGLGYTSLVLARHCARVTAVDTSKDTLAVLRDNITAGTIKNIDVVEGDLFSMEPIPKYDAMVFCFFGRLEETLRAAKAQCTGTVFMVKKNWRNHRFTPGEMPLKRFTFQQTQLELDALQIPYRAETFLIEMGQPFRSIEDAMLFFETYRQEDDDENIAPEKIKRLLCATESDVFPYFLPAERTLGIVAIHTKDIPERY
ncbi:MAG TPA: methyltransferase domain-containing protein [Clostridia bacterium]|nr:methyltransferase domain-containing protein [Clostridia bacterium]